MNGAIENFGAFLQKNGVIDIGEIRTEENVRVAVAGDKAGEESGAYKLFMNQGNGIPSGYVNNYRTGAYEQWNGKAIEGSKAVSSLELQKRKAEKQRVQDNLHQKKFKEFKREWNSLEKASPLHQYAVNKGLRTAFFIRHDVKVDAKHNLVFAVKNKSGEITNLQRIWSNGNKQMEKDGVLAGSFVEINGKDSGFVLIAEGVSTAATLNDITGIRTYASLTGNNLSHVAAVVREKHPEKAIVIAGDNDYRLTLENKVNAGLVHAEQAAKEVNGKAIFPPFSLMELAAGRTDWNDFNKDKGFSKTRDVLRTAFRKIIDTGKETAKTKSQDIER